MISALLYWGAVSLGLVSNFYILVSGTFPIFVQGFVQCLDPAHLGVYDRFDRGHGCGLVPVL